MGRERTATAAGTARTPAVPTVATVLATAPPNTRALERSKAGLTRQRALGRLGATKATIARSADPDPTTGRDVRGQERTDDLAGPTVDTELASNGEVTRYLPDHRIRADTEDGRPLRDRHIAEPEHTTENIDRRRADRTDRVEARIDDDFPVCRPVVERRLDTIEIETRSDRAGRDISTRLGENSIEIDLIQLREGFDNRVELWSQQRPGSERSRNRVERQVRAIRLARQITEVGRYNDLDLRVVRQDSDRPQHDQPAVIGVRLEIDSRRNPLVSTELRIVILQEDPTSVLISAHQRVGAQRRRDVRGRRIERLIELNPNFDRNVAGAVQRDFVAVVARPHIDPDHAGTTDRLVAEQLVQLRALGRAERRRERKVQSPRAGIRQHGAVLLIARGERHDVLSASTETAVVVVVVARKRRPENQSAAHLGITARRAKLERPPNLLLQRVSVQVENLKLDRVQVRRTQLDERREVQQDWVVQENLGTVGRR